MGMMANIKKIFTLNCEESSRLLSSKQDTALTQTEKLALHLHLLICRSCRRYNKQLGAIRSVFRILNKKDTDTPELKLSDKKRDQIKKTIAEKGDFENK